MKKTILLIFPILCCILNLSCENKDSDMSLAESIALFGHSLEIEGTFDGISLRHYNTGRCDITAISDDEVSLYFDLWWWEGGGFEITVPKMSLSGNPHDVYFDLESEEVTVFQFMVAKHYSVPTVITGWIKQLDGPTQLEIYTIPEPTYDCDFTITCDLDGRELSLRITKLWPYQFIWD